VLCRPQRKKHSLIPPKLGSHQKQKHFPEPTSVIDSPLLGSATENVFLKNRQNVEKLAQI
jgi:hypothetical protein